jgi:hypothetical protein
LPPAVTQSIADAKGRFAPEISVQGEDRRVAEAVVKDALAQSIRLMMLFAAALALAAAACAAISITPARARNPGEPAHR